MRSFNQFAHFFSLSGILVFFFNFIYINIFIAGNLCVESLALILFALFYGELLISIWIHFSATHSNTSATLRGEWVSVCAVADEVYGREEEKRQFFVWWFFAKDPVNAKDKSRMIKILFIKNLFNVNVAVERVFSVLHIFASFVCCVFIFRSPRARFFLSILFLCTKSFELSNFYCENLFIRIKEIWQ